MTKKRNNYWINRANERMDEYQKDASDVMNKLNANYDKAIRDINQDIKDIFYRFAKDSDLTLEQAQNLLNSKISIKEFDGIKTKINNIKDEELKSYMIAQLNSRAYKARITRLEAIKENIYINLKKVADVELEQTRKLYISSLNYSYYRNTFDIQKGIGEVFDFSPLPVSFVEEILKNKWSGQNYSTRIWQNNEVLASKLEEVVTSGLMQGKSSKRMAEELKDMTTYGKFATERLIRTETTFVTNLGEIESYKAAGIEKYIFVATLDLRTSKLCRKHDRKVYIVAKAVPGKNLPPLHPYCRSTTRAYIKGMKLGHRTARDPKTGKTYQIDNMNYEEWYQKFVLDKYGEQDAAKFEKMIKNKASDRKQYDRYKNILGKEAPKNFAEFRDLKYNDSNEWKLMQGYYRGITKGSLTPLANFKLYKDMDVQIKTNLIEIKAYNDINIKSRSIHFIERAIGSIEQKRSGVEILDIKNTLISPNKVGEIRIVNGDKSIKLYGDNNMVTVNPDTGNLVQVNPRKKVK